MDNKKEEIINLGTVIRKVISRRRAFYKSLPVAFILSSLLIITVPRTYNSSALLAPEMGGNMAAGGALGSIASSFGLDLSQMQSSDAISPLLYPDLMDDNGFIFSLLSIKVKSVDGEINTTYYDYLDKHQKKVWWKAPIGWIGKIMPKGSPVAAPSKSKPSPYWLSERANTLAEMARSNIRLSVDKKTGVIGITVTAQDPLICKTMVDSVAVKLQHFITEYRTNKARIDLLYYRELLAKSKSDYEKARQLYGFYADANQDVSLQSYQLKANDLENDMQLKFNTYSTINTQYQAALAKVQERTPAFTQLQGASVPVKPSGPKRMLFVIGMLFLTAFGTVVYILKEDIKGFYSLQT